MSHLRSLSSSARRRHADPTFEKLMSVYKHYLKALPVISLILSSPSQSLPLSHLSHPSIHQRLLHLHKGAPHFLRSFPHIFTLSPDPTTLHPTVALAPPASRILVQESCAANEAAGECADRLVRVLMMSPSMAVPLRAVFRVWRELGLPDEFEERVLRERRDLFRVRNNPKERNTHILVLVGGFDGERFVPKVEEWRSGEGLKKKKVDDMELRYGFKQEFPPSMKLTKNFRTKLKEWQRLPYIGPYEPFDGGVKRSREGLKRMEKRAVGIVHEFLSLTVEKMAEVEQVSQFRKWFGIDLNIRDLFLDHPGIFYLSTRARGTLCFFGRLMRRGCRLNQIQYIMRGGSFLSLYPCEGEGVVITDDAMAVRTRIETVEEEEEEEEDY